MIKQIKQMLLLPRCIFLVLRAYITGKDYYIINAELSVLILWPVRLNAYFYNNSYRKSGWSNYLAEDSAFDAYPIWSRKKRHD